MALGVAAEFHIIVTRFRLLKYTSFIRLHSGYGIGMVMDMYNQNNCKIDIVCNDVTLRNCIHNRA